MKLAFKQFRVLMWKCYIIRKRHWMTTLFEFFFSLVANIIMVAVVSKISHKIHPTTAPSTDANRPLSEHLWNNETIWPDPQYRLSDHLWKFIFARPKILYTPQNNVTQRFMDELEFVLRERVVSLKTRVEYFGFDSEEALLNEYAKLNNNSDMSKGLIGIVFPLQRPRPAGEQEDPQNAEAIFNEEMNSFLDQFSYKIRTTSFSINGFYPEKQSAGPYKSNLYLQDDYTTKSFIETQIFVNEAYLSLLLKRNKISLMSEEERENYARKKEDRQKKIDDSLAILDLINKTLDHPNNQSMPDSINDLNGDRPGPGRRENEEKRIIDLLNAFLADNPFLREGEEHPEMLRHLIELLAVEHPLFIQDIQAMRMPYPKYIERPPTSLIDLVPYVITNGRGIPGGSNGGP